MNKNNLLFTLIPFLFNLSCLVSFSRDASIPKWEEPTQLMQPVTFILRSNSKPSEKTEEKEKTTRSRLPENDPLRQMLEVKMKNLFPDQIAACKCLVDFNVYLNEEPPKEERFEYIVEISTDTSYKSGTLRSILLYLDIFTLTLIPYQSVKETSYQATIFDRNHKELGKITGSAEVSSYIQLFLFPLMFTKYSRPNRVPMLTWFTQDLFRSGLIPKVEND
ncbi:hypothetical protein EHO59_13845 [Leptospira semungkisensis]|uniref:Uncharacterized protein n=1 Tax=Leptospira semungkisensis TaxID=2484985 RepID=A0A4R9FSV3_9LEPT|nr:hypothetical protein [Leptospira semungkisensis]TGK00997.1 hypothetical protein EHO59_13845 [Leptospira semungkisensis]